MKEKKRLNQIAQVIYDKKGSNIIALDVRQISTLTEYFILAEGDAERHVAAIARAVIEQQMEEKHSPFHVEGLQNGDWVVLDYGHIMVHLFHPDVREKYSLETLWRYAHIIDLDIIVGNVG